MPLLDDCSLPFVRRKFIAALTAAQALNSRALTVDPKGRGLAVSARILPGLLLAYPFFARSCGYCFIPIKSKRNSMQQPAALLATSVAA